MRKPRPALGPNGKFTLGPREYVFTRERLLEPEMNALILDKSVGRKNIKRSGTIGGLLQTIPNVTRGFVASVYNVRTHGHPLT